MLANPMVLASAAEFDINDLDRFTYEKGTFKGEEVSENIATITFNYPEKANAINEQSFLELNHILDHVAQEYISDDPVEVVILTGAKEWFCAGAELGRGGVEYDFDGNKYDKATYFHDAGHEELKKYFAMERAELDMFNKLLRLPQVVVGALNGPATGLGLYVGTATDIRIAHREKAVFGQNSTDLGLIPMHMGLLKEMIGPWQAKRFMFRGQKSFPNFFDAEEARFTGLVDEVAPGDEFESRIREVAEDIASMPAEEVRMIKEAMNLPLIHENEQIATREFALQTTIRGRDFQREIQQRHIENFTGAGKKEQSKAE